ncbi:hypothetical protein [Gemella morbillorum]
MSKLKWELVPEWEGGVQYATKTDDFFFWITDNEDQEKTWSLELARRHKFGGGCFGSMFIRNFKSLKSAKAYVTRNYLIGR